MSQILKACRTCLKFVDDKNYTKINNQNIIKCMLLDFLPQIDFEVVNDPVICEYCLSALSLSYEFKNKCKAVEQHIKEIININKITTKSIELTLIVRKTWGDRKTTTYDNELKNSNEVVLFKNSINSGNIYEDFLEKYAQKKLDSFEKPVQTIQQYLLLKNKEEHVETTSIDHDYFKSDNIEIVQEDEIVLKLENDATNFKTESIVVKFEPKNEISCPHCNEIFKTKVRLNDHLRKDHQNISYECKDCVLRFPNYGQYKNHIELHKNEKFKCETCDELFFKSGELNVHRQMVHGNQKPYKTYALNKIRQKSSLIDPLICQICVVKFGSKQELKNHMKVHATLKTSFLCDHCGKLCRSRESLRTHLLTHSQQKKYVCYCCGKSFKYYSTMHEHMKTHTSTPPFKCGQCPKTFYMKSKLKLHEISHSEERNFECTQCKKRFKFYSTLVSHTNVAHVAVKTYTCDVCSQVFKRSDYLKNHKRRKHSANQQRYQCPTCPKSFTWKENLKNHEATAHSTERQFPCDQCEKKYATKSLLKQHTKLVHSSNVQCKFCDKILQNKANLADHMRSHSGVRPFNCNICGQAFVNKSNCRRHEQMHEKDGVLCQECYKRFDNEELLQNHVKTHTKRKNYQCKECGEEFARKFVLISHEKSHEKGEEEVNQDDREGGIVCVEVVEGGEESEDESMIYEEGHIVEHIYIDTSE